MNLYKAVCKVSPSIQKVKLSSPAIKKAQEEDPGLFKFKQVDYGFHVLISISSAHGPYCPGWQSLRTLTW